jgi:hypothetical protein
MKCYNKSNPKKKGKRKPNEPRENILQCVGVGGCFRIWLKDENPHACPHCGKVLAVKSTKLEHAEGELTEITPEMAEMMKARNKKALSSAKSLEELQRHASVQGYSPGRSYRFLLPISELSQILRDHRYPLSYDG